MNRTVPTTTLRVEVPTNYQELEARFRLVRYTIPPVIKHLKKWAQLHIALKEQLDHPYKVFTHSKGGSWVVYVLYPVNTPPKTISLNFLPHNKVLSSTTISFSEIAFHNLLKLLQLNYFSRPDELRFVGQDKCYVYAKKWGEDNHTCLEIELKGDMQNRSEPRIQLFKVIGHARTFYPASLKTDSEKYNTYYARTIRHNQAFFRQLKAREVQSFANPVYFTYSNKEYPARLDYHSLKEVKNSRGLILYRFIGGFTSYLASFGIKASSLERAFIEFKTLKGNLGLPLEKLGTVYVYDNRLSESGPPLSDYTTLFTQLNPALTFEAIANFDNSFSGSVLVIQDYQKRDFEEGGNLYGETDPYQSLYYACPAVPKQSFDVNPNDSKTSADRTTYLTYPLPEKEEAFVKKLAMSLNQLLLKEIVMRRRDITEYGLPFVDRVASFVRKKTYAGTTHEVMLYVKDNILHCIDCRDEARRTERSSRIKQYGLVWDELEEWLLDRYKPDRDREKDDTLAAFDAILRPCNFIEVENLEERVLYDYDKILARLEAQQQKQPVEALILAPHYDNIREKSMFSLAELETKGLISGKRHPTTKLEETSLAFYQLLTEYDDIILGSSKPSLSLEDITNGDLVPELAQLFGVIPDDEGKFDKKKFTRKIKHWYRRAGIFASPKAGDLTLYQGIWYTEDNCFTVGAPDPIKFKQPKANLIRRFTAYNPNEAFNIEEFLRSVSVRFVRLNQYTVVPYYFHLIDIYVQNVLRFQLG